VGLDEENISTNELPRWLCDDNVRKGIQSLLELDRCMEEQSRLSRERCALQEWMIEEWRCVNLAMESTGD